MKKYGLFLLFVLCVVSTFRAHVKDKQLHEMMERRPVVYLARHPLTGSILVSVDGEIFIFRSACHPSVKASIGASR